MCLRFETEKTALAKTTAMTARVTVMPMEPMISSGLRPKRSMVAGEDGHREGIVLGEAV